jgi:hypothetical protein
MGIDYNQFVDWNSPFLRNSYQPPTTQVTFGGMVTARPTARDLQYDLALRQLYQAQADKQKFVDEIVNKRPQAAIPNLKNDTGGDQDSPSGNNNDSKSGGNDDFLATLMSLLNNATTSQRVRIGDMEQDYTGTLPELANTIRNIYATNISRELGLDQNAASRYAADHASAAQKYAADKRFQEIEAANKNRLELLAKEQERQRQREGLFQQMAAGIGAPVFALSGPRIRT